MVRKDGRRIKRKNFLGGIDLEKPNEAVKDIGDVIPKAVKVDGEQRTMEELVGKVLIVEKFGTRPSQFGDDKEYATVQAFADGEKIWFNTGSAVILDTLKQVAENLPVRCRVEQRKSDKGRRYFVLVSAKE